MYVPGWCVCVCVSVSVCLCVRGKLAKALWQTTVRRRKNGVSLSRALVLLTYFFFLSVTPPKKRGHPHRAKHAPFLKQNAHTNTASKVAKRDWLWASQRSLVLASSSGGKTDPPRHSITCSDRQRCKEKEWALNRERNWENLEIRACSLERLEMYLCVWGWAFTHTYTHTCVLKGHSGNIQHYPDFSGVVPD